MERGEWVRSLKVGDRVAYYGRGFGDRNQVLTVEEVSTRKNAKTKVVNAGGMWFNSWGSAGDGYYTSQIEPLTPELEEQFRTEQRIAFCKQSGKNLDWSKVSKENMDAVRDCILKLKGLLV